MPYPGRDTWNTETVIYTPSGIYDADRRIDKEEDESEEQPKEEKAVPNDFYRIISPS
jgi:hypothetical protein